MLSRLRMAGAMPPGQPSVTIRKLEALLEEARRIADILDLGLVAIKSEEALLLLKEHVSGPALPDDAASD